MRSSFRITAQCRSWMLLVGLCWWSGCGLSNASDPQKAAAEIDRILSQEYPAAEPGAAVIVSREGKTILSKCYGLADVEKKMPVTPGTVFRLASLTKAFTSTAILMLAEQGLVELDAPAEKYLPELPAAVRGIPIRQLLAHTSGLADYLDRPDSMEWVRSDYTVGQLIGSFKDRSRAFAQGEKTGYSNSNYILLGAIVERVSGLTFGEFARKNIFDPLGMKSSFCNCALKDVPRLAAAYEPERTANKEPDWARLVVARPYTMTALYAAGGCLSSAADLATFVEALHSGRLLPKGRLTESFRPATLNNGTSGARALGGWQIDRVNARRAFMMGGALPGVCTWMILMPDDNAAVILLSNRTPGKPRCGTLAVRIAAAANGN